MQPPVSLTVIHSPVVLPYISNIVQWINIIPDIVDQSDTLNDLVLFLDQCDLYFMISVILTYLEHCLVDNNHTMDNDSV